MAHDIIWTGKPGDETFYGKDGDDTIQGYTGNDKLYGGAGKDVIDGEDDNDKLFGNKGNDSLDGGRGNDVLRGGHGADIFIFQDHDAHDLFADFHGAASVADGMSHDRIALLYLSSIKGYDDLMAHHASQDGDNVVIDGHHGDVLTIRNVQLDQLTEGDFIF